MKVSRLENGLTVITNPLYVDYLAVAVSIGDGMLYESKKESSHLLEHMLFEGTKTKRSNEILDRFQDISFGEYNADTKFDTIDIYSLLEKSRADEITSLLADILQNSTFPKDRIEKEREAMRLELNGYRDDVSHITSQALYQKMFGSKDLNQAVELPKDSEISAIDREDLIDNYNRFFRPSNVTIVFYGGITPVNADKLVEKYFKDFNGKFGGIKRLNIPPKYDTKEKNIHEKDLYQPIVAFGIPTIPFNKENRTDRISLSVLSDIIDQRLTKALRTDTGYVYGVNTSVVNYLDFGSLLIDTECSIDNLPKVKDLVHSAIDRIREGEVTKEELFKIIKNSLASYKVKRFIDPITGAVQIADTYSYIKDAGYVESMEKEVDLTIDDLRRVADRYIGSDKMSTVSLLPKDPQLKPFNK